MSGLRPFGDAAFAATARRCGRGEGLSAGMLRLNVSIRFIMFSREGAAAGGGVRRTATNNMERCMKLPPQELSVKSYAEDTTVTSVARLTPVT